MVMAHGLKECGAGHVGGGTRWGSVGTVPNQREWKSRGLARIVVLW